MIIRCHECRHEQGGEATTPQECVACGAAFTYAAGYEAGANAENRESAIEYNALEELEETLYGSRQERPGAAQWFKLIGMRNGHRLTVNMRAASKRIRELEARLQTVNVCEGGE